MTRQVRIYEDDAKLIELILTTRERKVTFADIVSEAINSKFKEAKSETENILRRIEEVSDTESASQPKRRNTKG